MQLDLGVGITRSRVVSVDPETGKRGGSKLGAPCGCFTCTLIYNAAGQWTRREPHATVYHVLGLLYCEEHVEAAICSTQAALRRARGDA